MSSNDSFSERHGLRPPSAEITIREDAPRSLRHFAIEAAVEAGQGVDSLRTIVCRVLHEAPNPDNWSRGNIRREVDELLAHAPWFKVYDIVERICSSMVVAADGGRREQYVDRMNAFCVEKGIGWKLVDCSVLARGDEGFETATRGALAATQAAGHATAANEIREAIADLSRRPDPDLTGAIQHGMAALECVAREVVGDPNATLGDILKRHPNLVPPPLDQALEKAWGFASQSGRHVSQGKTRATRTPNSSWA